MKKENPMNRPRILPLSDSRYGVPMRGRPINKFIAALAGAIALLAFPAAFRRSRPSVSIGPAFELAADARPDPVPLRWVGGGVLAKVTINGADAGWFKIGTGWVRSSIDPQVAARLKLPMVADLGVIADSMDDIRGGTTKSYRADVLQCGGASATDVCLLPSDMADLSKESVKMYGDGISGVLGWDLLRTLPFLPRRCPTSHGLRISRWHCFSVMKNWSLGS